jgi:hypothetical protein
MAKWQLLGNEGKSRIIGLDAPSALRFWWPFVRLGGAVQR